MKSDVPLLVHLGLLELDVGAVEPVPEAEPPVAGVKPVEDQTIVTLAQSNVSQLLDFYFSNNLSTFLVPTSYVKTPRPTNLKHKFRHEFVVEKL